MRYLEEGKLTGCFVCEAMRGEASSESLLLLKFRTAGVLLNRYPYSTGHLMIVPEKHVNSMTNLSLKELSDITFLLRESERILKHAYNPDGFNVGVNLGAAAGAGLKDHLHVHIMPRWLGDTNFMTTCSETRIIPELLSDSYTKLVGAFQMIKDFPRE